MALLLALAAVLPCFSNAEGGVPSPANWIVPALIPVVGEDPNGVPDPRGEIHIVARDLANNPMPGVEVVIDFSVCTELRLCADPRDPDAIVDCAAHRVRKLTDANGEVRFRIVGCSSGAPGTPGSPANSARIYGDGVLEASPSVAIYDLVGCNGASAADLSAWLDDFFNGWNPARGDYDGSGQIGPADLGLWLKTFFAAGSLANCASGGPCSP